LADLLMAIQDRCRNSLIAAVADQSSPGIPKPVLGNLRHSIATLRIVDDRWQ
jgi:hypothetical protein